MKYMSEPRQQALDRGLKTFDGEHCLHGHGTKRFTNCGSCVTCKKISWRAGQSARNKRNREKAKELALPPVCGFQPF